MNTATVFLAAFFAAGTAWGKWTDDIANPKTPDGEPLVVETFPVQPTHGCGWRQVRREHPKRARKSLSSWRRAKPLKSAMERQIAS